MIKKLFFLPFRMVRGKGGKSVSLIGLSAVLSFTVFAGSMIASSLRNGFNSLRNRLGADIMVVPEDAGETGLEGILLQGNTGYFYMDSGIYDKIASLPGVGKCTKQFFLASAKASCCSVKVQIIGFDPETDFVIMPWIERSTGDEIEDYDVVVGNGLNAFAGDTLLFYGTQVHVVSKLAETGTSYDYSVFTNENTIRTLISSSIEKKLNDFGDIDPGGVVSSILIDVADEYTSEEVISEINEAVDGVIAVQTGSMISVITSSLKGISNLTEIVSVLVWIVVMVIMMAVFFMSTDRRRKEFALLRLIGVSGAGLTREVIAEAFIVSLAGGAVGIISGLVIVFSFSKLIEKMLGLPYLNPGAGVVVGLGLLAAILSIVSSAAASSLPAIKTGRMDTALVLRGGRR